MAAVNVVGAANTLGPPAACGSYGAPSGGAACIGADMGAPDIGAPDIGAPDIGAADMGAADTGAPDDGAGAAGWVTAAGPPEVGRCRELRSMASDRRDRLTDSPDISPLSAP
ncbi:hypothetical protein GCM10010399_70950 [Dactylosporangium fulvum]|uniref:Uncharacterized protein n=1 Tax=Dactylosporangium fulvum TaxID=53359 RepID=A0ABY5W3N7_9ACTN|nr:hypothetical protein [Dactylosporangium fulvum]UWP84147.1 hypothetical protein Dfulv_07855 [Dactylosporangium fulvum]